LIENQKDSMLTTKSQLQSALSTDDDWKQSFATILSLDNGKPYAEAMGEVLYVASFVS
jgi:acyl-CoA reductase-like NAD-dependent aldehyde dehydrogenase